MFDNPINNGQLKLGIGLSRLSAHRQAINTEKHMLLERSEISVKEGTQGEFLSIMADKGLPILAGFPGVLKAELGQGVENPTKFLFLVEWQSLEDHTAFNQHEIHKEFLMLFAPFAQGGAMEHFRMLQAA